MVLAYPPQRSVSLLDTNSSHPPQGGETEIVIEKNNLLATFPPLGDEDYNNYKFYQVDKGQFSTPQTDFIWGISDSVGPGIFKEGSGFDIRVFAGLGRADISQARFNGQVFDPEMIINVIQLSDDQLHLFVWEFNNVIHEYVLSAPRVFPLPGTSPNFTFEPIDMNGRDMKLIDNGHKMVIAGIDLGANKSVIQIVELPSRNSFKITPISQQIFNPEFIQSLASCEFSNNEIILYVVDSSNKQIKQFNLTERLKLPDDTTPPDKFFVFDPPILASNGNMRMFADGSTFYLMSNNPMQISQYSTDGKNQMPTSNKNPDEFFSITVDNNLRAMSVSVGREFIWFSGRDTNKIYELFIPSVPLEYEVTTVNVSTGDFVIKVKVPALQDLSFIQLAFGNPVATDNSVLLGSRNILSTSTTPLLTKDEKNFLVDDQGNRFKV